MSETPTAHERPVLVIGAAGLVGGHMVRAFGSRARATFFRRHRAGSEVVDITDARAVRDVVDRTDPGVVVLAAAEPWVDKCEREPDATRRVNVGGTENARTAADRVGACLVVFSSEYVFDGTAGPYGEEAAVAPLNEYGRQKVELERIARSGRHLICRTSGVFGEDEARKNFVLQLVDRLSAGERFQVPSDQLITPTYAPDLAAALVELIALPVEGTFHVCGPQVIRRSEFALQVVRAFTLRADLLEAVPTSDLGSLAPRPLGAGLSDGKLRSSIGHGLSRADAGLREMADGGASSRR